MIQLILDSSVVLKWFRTENEPNRPEALTIRSMVEAGEIAVVVPPIFFLEAINVAARSWGMTEEDLHLLVDELFALEFTVMEPDLHIVARRTGGGLTAYDAAYAAVAEAQRTALITADGPLARLAADVTMRLADFDAAEFRR